MSDKLGERLIASAERMVDYYDRLLGILQRVGNESRSLIVWLVAIAGFAIINTPSLASRGMQNWATPLAPTAWAVTALLGIVTHWQFRNRSIAEIETYIARRELLLGYIANGSESATMGDLNGILSNEKEPLPARFKAQLSVTRFTDRLELATMLGFAFSMALAIRAYLFL